MNANNTLRYLSRVWDEPVVKVGADTAMWGKGRRKGKGQRTNRCGDEKNAM
jgi:hypothetical protein